MKISYSSGTKLKYQIQWTTYGSVCQFQWSPHSLHLFLTYQLNLLNQFIEGMKYEFIQRTLYLLLLLNL